MTRASIAVRRAAPVPALPRSRAPVVFGILLLLFGALIARSLYLQWIDNAFLQGQGSSRYSREIEVPAHRGRIVDRSGELASLVSPASGRTYSAHALWSLNLPTYEPGPATCPGCAAGLPLEAPGSSGTSAAADKSAVTT